MKPLIGVLVFLFALALTYKATDSSEGRKKAGYATYPAKALNGLTEDLREGTRDGMDRVGALPSPRGDTAEYNQAQQGVWVAQPGSRSWKASDKGAPFKVITNTGATLKVGDTGALLHWKTTEGTLTLWWEPNKGQHFRFDGETKTPIELKEEIRLWKATVEMAVSPLPGKNTVDVTVSLP